jgi:four helix bundle protein
MGAFSKKEFAAKMGIAYKEARESEYWIQLLFASGYLAEEEHASLQRDIQELLRMLGAILRNTSEKFSSQIDSKRPSPFNSSFHILH